MALLLALMAWLAEYSIGLMLVGAEMGRHMGKPVTSYGKLGAAAFGVCTLSRPAVARWCCCVNVAPRGWPAVSLVPL